MPYWWSSVKTILSLTNWLLT